VNYGTSGSLKFREFVSDEYFDISNVNYYYIILGTPFLKKWGICLDFNSQGIRIKGQIIPQGWPAEQTKALKVVSTHAELTSLS
jgi:hypothetical protein